MNREQIIDEAYNNFVTTVENNRPEGYTREVLTQEEFVKNSLIDPYFSKHWGLKIEERELSREERIDLYAKEYTTGVRNKYEPPFDDFIDAKLKTRNIPTKLVILTYNDETIQVYE